MKTILLTLTYLVGIGELILAVFFWVTHSKNEIRKVMGVLAGTIGIWVLLNALTAYRVPSDFVEAAIPWIFISSLFMITALVHVAILFPTPLMRLDELHRILLYIPAILLSVGFLMSDAFIQGYVLNPNISGYVTPGELYPLYSLFFAIFFVLALVLLFRKLKRADGMHRRMLREFLIALIIPGVPGILLSVQNEAQGLNYNTLIAPILSGVWLGAVTYIVARK